MSEPMPLGYATPQPPRPRRRFSRGLLGWLIFVGVAAVLFAQLRQSNHQYTPIPLSDFYGQVKAGNVAKLVISEDSIEGYFRTPVTFGPTSVLNFQTNLPLGATGTITQMLLQASPTIVIQAEPTNPFLSNFALPFIPWVLILGFIWFFVFRKSRNAAQRLPTPVVIVNPEVR